MTKTYLRLLIWYISLTLCLEGNASATAQSTSITDLSVRGSAELTLSVEASKSVYSRGEPIELKLILRNTGKNPQIVAKRLTLGMNIILDIHTPDGKPARRCGRISDEIVVFAAYYKTLSPGEAIPGKIIISCDDKKESMNPGYVFSDPGKYTIKVAYRLSVPREEYKRVFPDVEVPSGPVWTKVVTIEVR